ncbi:hypothetical protein SSBR45G_63630 [Bradyrhizobium sp. SSBR45G]|nr:hypothetical protein SSBR45G_63630 [Bradyrhizobium sp. SSBR45G]GLH88861.1 hypothetical protein SSBR45R_63220 [Bradyrhizobium sp. SSBR45R]
MHAHGTEAGLRNQGGSRVEQLLAALAPARLARRASRCPRSSFPAGHIFPSHVSLKLMFCCPGTTPKDDAGRRAADANSWHTEF